MEKKQINKVKSQLWSHIQYLNDRIVECLSDKPLISGDVWYDRYSILRSRYWLIDQLYFARSEAHFWKNVS